MGEMWKAWGEHRLEDFFVVKCQGRSLLACPGHKWENNIRKDLEEIG